MGSITEKKDASKTNGKVVDVDSLVGPTVAGSIKPCSTCGRDGMMPSHNGSKNCKSGSIASGGAKSHCSCDVCF